MDPTKTPEYKAGVAWAKKSAASLAELFSSRELVTSELRQRIFAEAVARWPSQHDSMDNDIRQTRFAAGAFKAMTEAMPLSPEGLAAVFEAASEIGMALGAEGSKAEALELLKEKPKAWWSTKIGDVAPIAILKAATMDWLRRFAKEKKLSRPRSIWEVLIDTMGSRELWILLEAEKISEEENGYWLYTVESPEYSFQMISRPAFHDGRVIQYPGEIVG